LLTDYHQLQEEDSFLGQLIVSELVKKFPAFYGTRSFITAFTKTRHLSLFRATSIHSTPNIVLFLETSHTRLGP